MMKLFKYKKVVFSIFGIVIFLCLIYLIIFGRALRQDENHFGILIALPRVILGSEVVRIDGEKLLARDREAFIRAMTRDGYVFTEQLGSGYMFAKDGQNFSVTSRMYSSHFMVFTKPIKNY